MEYYPNQYTQNSYTSYQLSNDLKNRNSQSFVEPSSNQFVNMNSQNSITNYKEIDPKIQTKHQTSNQYLNERQPISQSVNTHNASIDSVISHRLTQSPERNKQVSSYQRYQSNNSKLANNDNLQDYTKSVQNQYSTTIPQISTTSNYPSQNLNGNSYNTKTDYITHSYTTPKSLSNAYSGSFQANEQPYQPQQQQQKYPYYKNQNNTTTTTTNYYQYNDNKNSQHSISNNEHLIKTTKSQGSFQSTSQVDLNPQQLPNYQQKYNNLYTVSYDNQSYTQKTKNEQQPVQEKQYQYNPSDTLPNKQQITYNPQTNFQSQQQQSQNYTSYKSPEASQQQQYLQQSIGYQKENYQQIPQNSTQQNQQYKHSLFQPQQYEQQITNQQQQLNSGNIKQNQYEIPKQQQQQLKYYELVRQEENTKKAVYIQPQDEKNKEEKDIYLEQAKKKLEIINKSLQSHSRENSSSKIDNQNNATGNTILNQDYLPSVFNYNQCKDQKQTQNEINNIPVSQSNEYTSNTDDQINTPINKIAQPIRENVQERSSEYNNDSEENGNLDCLLKDVSPLRYQLKSPEIIHQRVNPNMQQHQNTGYQTHPIQNKVEKRKKASNSNNSKQIQKYYQPQQYNQNQNGQNNKNLQIDLFNNYKNKGNKIYSPNTSPLNHQIERTQTEPSEIHQQHIQQDQKVMNRYSSLLESPILPQSDIEYYENRKESGESYMDILYKPSQQTQSFVGESQARNQNMQKPRQKFQSFHQKQSQTHRDISSYSQMKQKNSQSINKQSLKNNQKCIQKEKVQANQNKQIPLQKSTDQNSKGQVKSNQQKGNGAKKNQDNSNANVDKAHQNGCIDLLAYKKNKVFNSQAILVNSQRKSINSNRAENSPRSIQKEVEKKSNQQQLQSKLKEQKKDLEEKMLPLLQRLQNNTNTLESLLQNSNNNTAELQNIKQDEQTSNSLIYLLQEDSQQMRNHDVFENQVTNNINQNNKTEEIQTYQQNKQQQQHLQEQQNGIINLYKNSNDSEEVHFQQNESQKQRQEPQTFIKIYQEENNLKCANQSNEQDEENARKIQLLKEDYMSSSLQPVNEVTEIQSQQSLLNSKNMSPKTGSMDMAQNPNIQKFILSSQESAKTDNHNKLLQENLEKKLLRFSNGGEYEKIIETKTENSTRQNLDNISSKDSTQNVHLGVEKNQTQQSIQEKEKEDEEEEKIEKENIKKNKIILKDNQKQWKKFQGKVDMNSQEQKQCSKKGQQNENKSISLYERGIQSQHKRQQIYEQNQKEKSKLDKKECSFIPITNQRKNQHILQKKNYSDFQQRNQMWQNNKDKKLENLQLMKSSQEISECTFSPKMVIKLLDQSSINSPIQTILNGRYFTSENGSYMWCNNQNNNSKDSNRVKSPKEEPQMIKKISN